MGAWIEIRLKVSTSSPKPVAPLVGAWIEIPLSRSSMISKSASLLSWERGLKSMKALSSADVQAVAPLVGAWIEIKIYAESPSGAVVAPLVGAWIEILFCIAPSAVSLSLLSWERGLKYARREPPSPLSRRSSRGSVD